jgi:hypothetical protein
MTSPSFAFEVLHVELRMLCHAFIFSYDTSIALCTIWYVCVSIPRSHYLTNDYWLHVWCLSSTSFTRLWWVVGERRRGGIYPDVSKCIFVLRGWDCGRDTLVIWPKRKSTQCIMCSLFSDCFVIKRVELVWILVSVYGSTGMCLEYGGDCESSPVRCRCILYQKKVCVKYIPWERVWKEKGPAGDRIRDLSNPNRESYH